MNARAHDPERELLEDIAGFFNDPLGFVLYAFAWGEADGLPREGPDDWQIDILELIRARLEAGENAGTATAEALRIAVASGHGIGKTALIAWIVLWFMSTREFPQIVVTASTQTQLATKTWRELAKWHRRLINKHWFTWTATKFSHVKHPDTWFAVAIPWSANNADAFAGTHEKFVLIIYDEANAVDDVIWDTTEGALTTAHGQVMWLAFGNYTKNTGRFHECFGRFKHRWEHRQIDSRTARMANKKQIDQWVKDYGEDSDFVRIRVRGVAPRAGSMQFIPGDLVERARTYKAEGYEHAAKILVLDVARFGDDQSVAACRQGRRFKIEWKVRGLDTVQLTEKFKDLIDEHDPDAIVVDGDGIGGAVCDNLRAAGYDKKLGTEKIILLEFHGSEVPNQPELYYNRRAEVWGEAREALKLGVQIDDDPELAADLTGPEYTYQRKGNFDVYLLESKADMKARGLASPDCGDTFCMSYAVKVAVHRKPPARPSRQPLTDGAPTGWMDS